MLFRCSALLCRLDDPRLWFGLLQQRARVCLGFHPPQARQIRLPVRGARRRRVQIWCAVGGAGYPGRLLVDPLGDDGTGRDTHSDRDPEGEELSMYRFLRRGRYGRTSSGPQRKRYWPATAILRAAWLSLPALALASMKSPRTSAPAAWARCTARPTPISSDRWRSRCCPPQWPATRIASRAFSAKRRCWRPSIIRTSGRSMVSRRRQTARPSSWNWSTATTCRSGSREGRSPSTRRCRSSSRSPTRSKRHTSGASFTAI